MSVAVSVTVSVAVSVAVNVAVCGLEPYFCSLKYSKRDLSRSFEL